MFKRSTKEILKQRVRRFYKDIEITTYLYYYKMEGSTSNYDTNFKIGLKVEKYSF